MCSLSVCVGMDSVDGFTTQTSQMNPRVYNMRPSSFCYSSSKLSRDYRSSLPGANQGPPVPGPVREAYRRLNA